MKHTWDKLQLRGKFLIRKHGEKRQIGRCKYRWKDVNIYLNEIRLESVD
jgi:hypothetical protein